MRITRELPEIPGEIPRLYVVTRNAQTVVASDVANWSRPGCESDAGGRHRTSALACHPDRRGRATDAEQLAQQLLSGSKEDETASRDGAWHVARLSPTPLRPEERHTAVNDLERDGMRLQIRTPGDLETMELVAYERVPPGPGQIEVAVTASSVNFADVLVAFGRYPAFEGHLPQLGTDFAGVVTAVGPDVTDHRSAIMSAVCTPMAAGVPSSPATPRSATIPAGLADDRRPR